MSCPCRKSNPALSARIYTDWAIPAPSNSGSGGSSSSSSSIGTVKARSRMRWLSGPHSYSGQEYEFHFRCHTQKDEAHPAAHPRGTGAYLSRTKTSQEWSWPLRPVSRLWMHEAISQFFLYDYLYWSRGEKSHGSTPSTSPSGSHDPYALYCPIPHQSTI
jgi:hypothetical protein